MRIIYGSTVFIAALVLATAAPAMQHRKRTTGAPRPGAVIVSRPVCQPLCATDLTPCDPPEFKHADGRCNMGGYGGLTAF